MSDAEMDRITPEFDHMEDHGATLAIDVKISPDNTHRYTCIGYEDGYCSLSIVEITEVGFQIDVLGYRFSKRKKNQNPISDWPMYLEKEIRKILFVNYFFNSIYQFISAVDKSHVGRNLFLKLHLEVPT